jgi:hypothetical protein
MDEVQEIAVTPNPKPTPVPPNGGSSGWLLWVLVFIFVAYPLGIGPAAKLHRCCPRARPAIETVYKPLVVLMEHCYPVRDSMLWYLSKVWKVDQ